MTTLAQLTMNAGEDIPGSVLKWNLESHAKYFDRVLIVDGNLTGDAKAYYNQFDNVTALDSPWKDDHAPQYRRFAEELDDGEWCLYLDDDEAPSKNLCIISSQLDQILAQAKGNVANSNIVILPSILYITEDGKRYYRALHRPLLHDPRNGGHTKPVLFKKTATLDFLTSPPPSAHVTPTHNAAQAAMYASGGWYYHFKSAEAYIINDCLFALMNPIAERYTPDEAKEFKQCLRDSGIKTIQDFRRATETHSWSDSLIRFAIANKYDYSRPISRLYMWYFEIAHTERTDHNPDWGVTVERVLAKEWLDTYRSSKKASELQEKMGGRISLETIDFIDVPSTQRRMVNA